jgi:hypothetical protein
VEPADSPARLRSKTRGREIWPYQKRQTRRGNLTGQDFGHPEGNSPILRKTRNEPPIYDMIRVIMKKQASDQQFHDRRHQERKRAEAEAAKRPPQKKSPPAAPISNPADPAPTPANESSNLAKARK